MKPEAPNDPTFSPRPVPWALGVAAQALALGIGLFFGLLRLLQLATDASVFRYQGF
jgi:hypothetical protein